MKTEEGADAAVKTVAEEAAAAKTVAEAATMKAVAEAATAKAAERRKTGEVGRGKLLPGMRWRILSCDAAPSERWLPPHF